MKNNNSLPGSLLWLSLALALLWVSCRRDADVIADERKLVAEYDPGVVAQWNKLLLEIERFTPGYLPPVSARAFGYVGLAVYETAVPGMPGYRSLGGHFPGLHLPAADKRAEYHYPAAINSAYLAIMHYLYPGIPAARYSEAVTLHNVLKDKFEREASPAVMAASIEWGKAVADAVFAWSATDPVGHEGFLRPNDPGYVPPSGAGKWQPTYPDYNPALLPHWGDVRTFAAKPDDKCKDPLAFSADPSSEFYAQALETHNKVSLIHEGKNHEDKWIAQFWSDDCPALTLTPAGRWIAIATQAVEKTDANLGKAVVVTAKVGMAICDAGIRCWGEKYRFNLLRPVDYVHLVMGHTSWNTIMCPDGSGRFYTPQFPSYPSGHGTFGAAAAEVLTAEFGQYMVMTDHTHEARHDFNGTPRTFSSFYEMAQENAYSRIPIGVHYRMDAEAAMDLGLKIGRRVNNLPWK